VTSPTSPYWTRMQYLKDRIYDRQMLRDAQVQNSADYRGFQNEITYLTQELRLWEANIGQISRLETTITTSRRNAEDNYRDGMYTAGHWSRLAAVSGLIGILLLVPGVQWSLKPLLIAGVTLLAVAGVAAFMSTRKSRSTWNEMAQANRESARLEAARNALIPTPRPPTEPYPRLSYDVIIRDLPPSPPGLRR
jgi:hypothetical protein